VRAIAYAYFGVLFGATLAVAVMDFAPHECPPRDPREDMILDEVDVHVANLARIRNAYADLERRDGRRSDRYLVSRRVD
jgi:hypothetical protein